MNVRTIPELFYQSLDEHPRLECLGRHDGERWRAESSGVIRTVVEAAALGLRSLGVGPGDRVALISYNRPEWAIADYAVQLLGAVVVPCYTTLPPATLAYILRDAGAKAVIVSTPELLAGLRALHPELPEVRHWILLDAGDRPAAQDLTWKDVIGRGYAASVAGRAALREEALKIPPDRLASLVYTSGTTGNPKGVMLTQENLVSNVVASAEIIRLAPTDKAMSFLPLCHIFERMVDYVYFLQGVPIWYARSMDTVADDLREVRPTVMAAVPRFYEKIHARVREAIASAPAWRQGLAGWAVRVGEAHGEFRRTGRGAPPGLDLKWRLARLLVFRKLAARLGGRVGMFLSGGAPLRADIARFFYAAGIPILEGYGLTETSPVVSLNRPNALAFGTVGRLLTGVEVKIAEDGEILVRGPNVMKGYWNLPDETAAALKDGWFRTGDIGRFDDAMFLSITDRKKDLLKTSGGKYVAPQPIENRLKEDSLVAQAVVVGDGRKFVSALIVPNFEALERVAGAGGDGRASLPARPDVVARYQEIVDRANAGLAPFETVKKFALLPEELTKEKGELTETLKVKRRVVEERYRAVIDGLYAE